MAHLTLVFPTFSIHKWHLSEAFDVNLKALGRGTSISYWSTVDGGNADTFHHRYYYVPGPIMLNTRGLCTVRVILRKKETDQISSSSEGPGFNGAEYVVLLLLTRGSWRKSGTQTHTEGKTRKISTNCPLAWESNVI